MLCPKCFADIPDDRDRCPECGANTDGAGTSSYAPSLPSHSSSPNYSSAGDAVSPFGAVFRALNLSGGNFKNLFIGGLINLIPIFGLVCMVGYQVEYIGKIINRQDPEHYPDLSENTLPRMAEIFLKGLNYCIAAFFYVIGIFAVDLLIMIPFWTALVAAVASLSKSSADGVAAILAILASVVVPIIVLIAITFIMAMFLPLLQVLYAASDRTFFDAFRIGDAFRLIFKDPGGYVMTLITMLVVAFVFFSISTMVSAVTIVPIIGAVFYYVFVSVFGLLITMAGASVFAEFYYKNRA